MAYTATTDSDSGNPNYFQFHTMKAGVDHPQCGPDEIFLSYGNAWTFGNAYPAYATLRRGTLVIDDFGTDRTEDAHGEFFPIFVLRSEYEELQASLNNH